MLNHTFEPVYDKDSKVLILGTFPSVKSRENKFYYGHPKNRFWHILAKITVDKVPVSIQEKKEMLLKNKIAIWDVIASCNITGSSDSSIRDVVVNDFTEILEQSSITHIFANGAKAYELYMKYSYPKTGTDIIKLPSTSPANAVYNVQMLYNEWKIIKKYISEDNNKFD